METYRRIPDVLFRLRTLFVWFERMEISTGMREGSGVLHTKIVELTGWGGKGPTSDEIERRSWNGYDRVNLLHNQTRT